MMQGAPRIHDLAAGRQAPRRLRALHIAMAFAATLAAAASPALAQGKRPAAPAADKHPPMTFTPGRLPESRACGAECADFIVADGEIGFGSALAYLLARKRIGDRALPVLLHSPGGYLIGATNLGRMWRKLGVTVIVAQAIAKPCGRSGAPDCDPADAAAGVRVFEIAPGKGECASACPFALAGGTTRVAPLSKSVGVHESYIDTEEGLGRAIDGMLSAEEKAQSKRETETELADYATEMGVDPDIARRSMRTSHDDMDWLTSSDVVRYRLAVTELSALPPSLAAALSRAAPSETDPKARRATETSAKSGVGAFTKRPRGRP